MGRVFRFSVAMVLLAVVVSPVVAGDSIYTPPNVATTSGGGDGGVLTATNARRVLANKETLPFTSTERTTTCFSGESNPMCMQITQITRYQVKVNGDGRVLARKRSCARVYRGNCTSWRSWEGWRALRYADTALVNGGDAGALWSRGPRIRISASGANVGSGSAMWYR